MKCLRVRTSRVPPPAGDRLSSRPAQARGPSVAPLPARGARSFPSRLQGTRGHGSTRNQFHLSSGGDQAWPQRESVPSFHRHRAAEGEPDPRDAPEPNCKRAVVEAERQYRDTKSHGTRRSPSYTSTALGHTAGLLSRRRGQLLAVSLVQLGFAPLLLHADALLHAAPRS